VIPLSRTDRFRVLGAVLIAVLLVPSVYAGATYSEPTTDVSRADAENVTFVSEQGMAEIVDDHSGRLIAVHTDSKARLWLHDEYRRYFDVDPLGPDRVLFTAEQRVDNGSFRRFAYVVNWRTGEQTVRFPVPADVHDIDYLGRGRYAVADIANDRAYVYDRSADRIVWEYDFARYFSAGEGGPPDDWTHLNDIDAVDGGDAFLLSPRNFDRVILVDRETKEVVWSLGREDAYDVLYEQHNPTLLSSDPPTVLVADSENDRVVEYRRENRSWNATWGYSGELTWPRDADRLPNGNTLIVDSGGDRVLEVSPDREVVWSYRTRRNPYDVERLSYGDEPAGPTMAELDDGAPDGAPPGRPQSLLDAAIEGVERLYTLARWMVPTWMHALELTTMVGAALVGGVWASVEVARLLPSGVGNWLAQRRVIDILGPLRSTVAAVLAAFAAITLLAGLAPRRVSTDVIGVGVLLLMAAWTTGAGGVLRRTGPRVRLAGSLILAIVGVLVGIGIALLASGYDAFVSYGIAVLCWWQSERIWTGRPEPSTAAEDRAGDE
jgi:hypothetical protein